MIDNKSKKRKVKKEIDSLIESIDNLTKEKDNIIYIYIYINEIANDYINEEQSKSEIEYDNWKRV